MKTYEMVFLGKNGCILKTIMLTHDSIKQAREAARFIYATTSINDVVKYKVRRLY